MNMVSRRLRQQHFHIVLISALAIALAGCAAFRGGGASPDPTTTPPTSTPLPTSTPEPTPDQTPDQTPTATFEHPTGATDVILRIEWGGGFVPMQTIATQMPQFTLYGDGTAVFRPLPDVNGINFNEPSPPFLTGHMSEDAVQALLDFALHDGGLANAMTNYDYPGVADAGTTMFTINARGVDKQVSVYALYDSTNEGPDQGERDALNRLQQRLNNFETEARAGAADSVTSYDPDAYKAVLFADTGGSPAEGVEPIDWPWTDIQPSDFVAADEQAWHVKILDRDHASKLTAVPNGGQLSIWVTAPDGSLVDFALRPLLPDEVATGSTS
jgi:hypothetical protein